MITTLSVTFIAIVKLFLISLGGYLLVRFRIFSRNATGDLAKLILYLPVPALLFVKMFQSFTPALIGELIIIPLGAVFMLILAWGVAALGCFLLAIPGEKRSLFTALMMFGNTGYIPIPLVMSILPEEQASLAVVYISLFLLIFSPLFWVFGIHMVAKGSQVESAPRKLISPPFVGILAGVLCSLIPPVRDFLHTHGNVIMESCRLLGETTVPLAMILIGAVIATLTFQNTKDWRIIGGLILLKMILFPFLVIGVLYLIPLPNLIRMVLAIEGMVPPATNLVIMAKSYGKDADLISLSLFTTYLFSLITIPCFILLASLLFPVF
jgi:predicted permease